MGERGKGEKKEGGRERKGGMGGGRERRQGDKNMTNRSIEMLT